MKRQPNTWTPAAACFIAMGVGLVTAEPNYVALTFIYYPAGVASIWFGLTLHQKGEVER